MSEPARVVLPGRPFSVTTAGRGMLVTLRDDRQPELVAGIAAVDPGKLTVEAVLEVESPREAAVVSGSNLVAVAQDPGAVSLIELDDRFRPYRVVVSVATTPGGSTGFLAYDGTGRLYATNEATGTLSVVRVDEFNPSAARLVASHAIGFMPMSVLTAAEGDAVLVATQYEDPEGVFSSLTAQPSRDEYYDLVGRLHRGAVKALARPTLESAPVLLDSLPVGNVARLVEGAHGLYWATLRAENELVAIGWDGSSLRIHARAATGPAPVAVATSGRLVFVANSNRFADSPGSITVFEHNDEALTERALIPTGRFPRAAVVSEGALFVAEHDDRTLARFSLDTLPIR